MPKKAHKKRTTLNLNIPKRIGNRTLTAKRGRGRRVVLVEEVHDEIPLDDSSSQKS